MFVRATFKTSGEHAAVVALPDGVSRVLVSGSAADMGAAGASGSCVEGWPCGQCFVRRQERTGR